MVQLQVMQLQMSRLEKQQVFALFCSQSRLGKTQFFMCFSLSRLEKTKLSRWEKTCSVQARKEKTTTCADERKRDFFLLHLLFSPSTSENAMCYSPHPRQKMLCVILPIHVRKCYVFFPFVLPIQVRENATPATGAMTPQQCGGSCDLKKSRKRRKQGGRRKKIAVLLSWLPIRSCWIGRKTT